MDDIPQSALGLDGGCRIPDGAGGGEDGLTDDSVDLYYYRLWPAEFIQMPQKVNPLLCFGDEGADVQLPLELLGDDGAQGPKGLHSVH